MLHAKALHYPSGFPMPRSPPLFICSSPGPDPVRKQRQWVSKKKPILKTAFLSFQQYRSNDNVYEELEHRGRFSDCDRLHSDEDFAEDELSLPGDRSLNKSSSENTTVATIYQERGAGSTSSNANENTAIYMERNRVERNSLLSSASSSANDNNPSRPNMRNSSSSNESNHHSTLNRINNNPAASSNGGVGSASFFRFRTSRPSSGKAKGNRQKTNNFSMDNLNSSADTTPVDEVPRGEISSGTGGPLAATGSVGNSDAISASPVNGNHIDGDTNNNSNICGRNNYYGTESEVERRNRINAQLSNPTLNVATIFRDRNIRYHPARANANYYAPPQHMMANRTNNNGETNNRSRTNPRMDRRRPASREASNNNTNSNSVNNNQEYLYHDPVYHENLVYDPYTNGNAGRSQIYNHQPYILPEFTTFRNYNNLNNPHQPLYNSAAVGSDSGYSQNTQTSGRSLWGRRKRAGNNNSNANAPTTPSALARNETSDTYEGSWGRFLSFLSIMFARNPKSERSHHQKIIPKTTLF